MGKGWDSAGVSFQADTWRAVLRVLKPGGHLLAFGGSRTVHRIAVAIEDAGFEVRDMIVWIYATGFPKSLDVSKAIDAAAGAERERVAGGVGSKGGETYSRDGGYVAGEAISSEPITDDARRWQGWGTALKPALEPVIVARKPLVGTVAANVLAHGTGALNIDGCRIATDDKWEGRNLPDATDGVTWGGALNAQSSSSHEGGRWPANVVLDEEAAAMLDEQTGESISRIGKPRGAAPGNGWGMSATGSEYDDRGGPSRFYFVAKASTAERNAGLDGFEERAAGGMSGRHDGSFDGHITYAKNVHPTVKPIALVRYLVRLVTPPDGIVLDPFLGSGTTGIATALEGFDFVGIERDQEYLDIARARIEFWREHGENGLEIVKAEERAEAKRQEVADAGQLDMFSGAA